MLGITESQGKLGANAAHRTGRLPDMEMKIMAHYAIAFDLDTTAMTQAGLTAADKTRIYQTEIPQALNLCGFTAHPQGSLYHTEAEQNPITAIMQLQSTLRHNAPNFCRYVRRVNVFRMEEWSDVTALIANRAPAPAPNGAEELAEQEDFNAATNV